MSRKDAINKEPTEVERDHEKEFEIAGNARQRGEDPSPDDRERGERSIADEPGPVDTGGGA